MKLEPPSSEDEDESRSSSGSGSTDDWQGACRVSGSGGSSRKALNKGRWSKDEDDRLKRSVQAHGTSDWAAVAHCFPDRSDVQCQQRWHKVVNPDLVKGSWSKEVGLFSPDPSLLLNSPPLVMFPGSHFTLSADEVRGGGSRTVV